MHKPYVLNKAIALTPSSSIYKNPYNPKGSLFYASKNKVVSYLNMRLIEK